jgi:hypothetical protein
VTATIQPYLVVDAVSDRGKADTAPYQAFLDWLRSEGIDPEKGTRCEVYEGDPPYAIVTLFELDEEGHAVVDELTDSCVTYTDIVTLSSLPPAREV